MHEVVVTIKGPYDVTTVSDLLPLFAGAEVTVSEERQPPSDGQKMKRSVWMEGHAATGERSTARFLGDFEAETFAEACHMAALTLDGHEELYSVGKLSFWGCKFYPTEKEARAMYG